MKKLGQIIWLLVKIALMAVGAFAVLMVLLIVAVALKAPRAQKIANKSVLVFDLNTEIRDSPVNEESEALERVFGRGNAALQLRAATIALRAAATDKRISGLYLRGSLLTGNYSSGYAALKELREAIQDFQKSGKPVIAYIENADNRDFYLDSVADQILLNPLGLVAFQGLAAQGIFLKGAEDKYGLELTPIRHGKYKAAIEPFIREDFSPENREQLDALLKVIWGDMRDTVAASRKIAPDQLQAMVDKQGLISAAAAKDQSLVTELAYEGQALDKLRQLTGTPANEAFPQVSISGYAHQFHIDPLPRAVARDKIAVIYAEGQIINGEGSAKNDGMVAGDKFARMIREIGRHKDVKALVLRVNSPGGSGQASEVILDELRRFNVDRPVVVSMGTVAASGGYFISMAARQIVAEPSTITGSIGVFGLALNAQKIANDHGITFDTVKTGALADLGAISRPMTPDEHAVIQGFIDNFYNVFIERVATNRNMTTNKVDDLAQGRVWSGADALKLGLVDELGGLQKAIDDAAKDARLGTNYAVVEYPVKKGLLEQLSEELNRNNQPLANDFSGRVLQTMARELRWFSALNDPQGIYVLLPFDIELN